MAGDPFDKSVLLIYVCMPQRNAWGENTKPMMDLKELGQHERGQTGTGHPQGVFPKCSDSIWYWLDLKGRGLCTKILPSHICSRWVQDRHSIRQSQLMWSLLFGWSGIHNPPAEGTSWAPQQRHLYFYSLPGPKVTIPFLILSAKRWIFEREARHLHNHIWNYPSASWTQHATVIEKIFIYFSHILSSLCQGKACLSCCQMNQKTPKHCSNAHILLLWKL